jgi:pyruvate carboxylase subunit B
MAGVVREIRVAADDEVEEGQVLAVVEAMKMQNELHARRAGQVKAVYVTVGQRVDQGTPLLVLV